MCEASDIERLVRDATGVSDWSIVEDQELSNYCSKEISAHQKDCSSKDCKDVVEFIESGGRKPQFMLSTFMNYLAFRGDLEEGNYVIDCGW